MQRRRPEEVVMTKNLSIAIAAGLLLVGPALAQDVAETPTQDPIKLQLRDGTGDGTPDRIREHLRTDPTVSEVAEGEPAGDQVRARARVRTQAREQVRSALAEQAGMPSEEAVMPGEGTGEKAAERHAAQSRKMEVERAALRHANRTLARENAGEGAAMRKGAGGHGGMAGSGPGAGDCTQSAETTRTGGMRYGGGGMMP
jgi:hypothetical protein